MADNPQDKAITRTTAVLGVGNPPTVSNGPGAGSGASITVNGNNAGGKITLVQGTGGTAGGNIMTLTLADGMSFPNGMSITFSAGNGNFATIVATLSVSTTNNTATLNFGAITLTAGATYIGYYSITGY